MRSSERAREGLCVPAQPLFLAVLLPMHLHGDVLCGHGTFCSRLHKKLLTGYLQTGVGKGGGGGEEVYFYYFFNGSRCYLSTCD